jgi:hypothetical protein
MSIYLNKDKVFSYYMSFSRDKYMNAKYNEIATRDIRFYMAISENPVNLASKGQT